MDFFEQMASDPELSNKSKQYWSASCLTRQLFQVPMLIFFDNDIFDVDKFSKLFLRDQKVWTKILV